MAILGALATLPGQARGAAAGVVHAQNWTGDPAAGGTLIADEWVRLGLEADAESVRRQSADGIVTTRTDVPCVDGAPASGLCPEVRELTLPSSDGAIGATFSRDRGAYLGDPNVVQPSDLAQTAALAAVALHPSQTGPLTTALAAWQTPPPGHGSMFERFDVTSPYGTDSEWLDAATRLPLELTVASGSGTVTTYWTYSPQLIDPATLGGHFFLQSAPSDAAQRQQTEYYPSGQVPATVTDQGGGSSYSPVTLGQSATLDGNDVCLASTNKFDFSEGSGDFADGQDADFTRIDAAYVAAPSNTSCAGASRRAGDAAVEISSFARGSAIAAQNEAALAGAQPVQFHITSASGARNVHGVLPSSLIVQVMPGGNGSEALGLANVGSATVLIRNSLPGAGASSAQAARAVSGVMRPLLARRGYRMHAVHRAHTAEGITHGHWLFTGSIYDQSSGTPNRNKRLDPVSVIWKGGGSASISNVRNYTQGYWNEAYIPSGYPGGKQMKPRDDNPLCRDAHYVWFRYNGSDPNRGKWEKSDDHGYMSTNGLCANQYHIRMWSSQALYDLTGAHLLEFVLAPIHHDHTKVCWIGPIPYPCHGTPDLSFDKARYAYAKVMSHNVCTFIHWRVNPESEAHNYQGYVYSGYVSRITFWLLSRHPGCRGV